MKILVRSYDLLTSKRGALLLLLLTAVASVPGTMIETPGYYRNFPFLLLPVLLAVSTAICTLRNAGSLPVPVLLVHIGFIVTICGFVVRSFGYVATVNIHEGATTTSAYRWDLERDMPLGYTLAVKGVHREYHSAPVRVGVLRGAEKVDLKELHVGEDFMLPPYRVVVERLDVTMKELMLTVLQEGRAVAAVSTSSDDGYPAGFPYRFRLVAYRDMPLKRSWVDLALYAGGKELIAGTTEVNSPFFWRRETFYNTALGTDDAGRPYAGIQIVRDPGRPVVFTGLVIASIGTLFMFGRRDCGSKGKKQRTPGI